MTAIAGIARAGKSPEIDQMLHRMAHRGPAGKEIVDRDGFTLGVAWTKTQSDAANDLTECFATQDLAGSSRSASAKVISEELILKRDPVGVAPLYYGYTKDGALCFASEVKGLLDLTTRANEFPPGSIMSKGEIYRYFTLEKKSPIPDPPEILAAELRRRLENSVRSCISSDTAGSWLSGGLDSSLMAALARPYLNDLYTFSVGYAGAPDLEYARLVAERIGSKHFELVVTSDDLIKVLPEVIYSLESFDALLVRSSLTNYLVARLASDHVDEVFSGEGGDELFAGYDYIKGMNPASLEDELIDILSRLHNTALQRVDRCASGNGIIAHVGFLDSDVLEYSLSIPVCYKLHDGIEKWILRKAVADILPEQVLNRSKAKFWEGAGVQDHIGMIADDKISDRDFQKERVLKNGWILNTKEELFYFRIFNQLFGSLEDFSWMGRTKGAPVV